MIDFIKYNYDCNTTYGLIQYGLFICLKFGFVFDPGLHDLQLQVLELFLFAFLFSVENGYHYLGQTE